MAQNAATPYERRIGPSVGAIEPAAPSRGSLAVIPSGIARVGDVLGEFGEKLEAAQTEHDLNGARITALRRLNERREALDRDQDYRTWESRFNDDAARIGDEVGGTLQNPNAREAFYGEYFRLWESNRASVRQGALERETQAAVAQLDDSLNTYAQQAAFAPNLVARRTIVDQATASVQGLVATGMLRAEAGQQRLERFQSTLAEVDVRRAIDRDPYRARAILKAGPVPGLDPLVQQQLYDKSDAEIAQREREARAAAREARADARERLMDLDRIVSAQETPDPALVRGAIGAVNAHGDAAMRAHLERTVTAITLGERMKGANLLELDEAASALDAEAAQRGGATSREAQAARAIRTQRGRVAAALREDPLGWAQSQGVVRIAPITFGAQDDWPSRIAAAEATARRYNIAPQYLTGAEADALKAYVATATPQQKLALSRMLVARLGHRAPAVFAAIAKDEPVLAQAGLMQSLGSPTGQAATNIAAADAVTGEPMLRERPELRAKGRNNIAVVNDLSVALGARSADAGRVLQAANGIYATRAARQGLTGDDVTGRGRAIYERAVQEASGARFQGNVQFGGITTMSGRNSIAVAVPSLMRADDFEDVWEGLDDKALVRGSRSNGRPLLPDGRPFPASEMRNTFPVSVGNGIYWLSTTDPRSGRTTPLTDERTGRAFVLDLLKAREER